MAKIKLSKVQKKAEQTAHALRSAGNEVNARMGRAAVRVLDLNSAIMKRDAWIPSADPRKVKAVGREQRELERAVERMAGQVAKACRRAGRAARKVAELMR